jgi:competence protein ComEC
MVANPFKVPIFSAALGAAFGFYGFVFFSNYQQKFEVYVLGLLFFLCGLVCIVNSFVFFKNRRLKQARIICISLAVGIVLGTTAFLPQMKKASAGIPFEDVTGLSGKLADDPHLLASGSGAFTFSMLSSRGKNGLEASAFGQVQVYFPEELYDSIKSRGRGSRIFIDGDFLPQNEKFSNSNPRFRASSLHVYEDSSLLHTVRTKIRLAVINTFEHERWGGLALALLLGVRDFLDTEMAENYQFAGCSHVLALSGMHLGIISALVAFILKKPLGLKKASALGAVIILGYVFLVGAQASLMRAAIMSSLGTIVILKGWPRNVISLLSAAFIIQIALFPSSAITISFILSYLALAGIVLFSPMFIEFLKGWMPDMLAAPLAASCAAFFVTIPVVGAFFGMIRPIGIAAGLVIVPLSTLFMILSIAWFCLQAIPFVNVLAASLIGKVLDFLYTILDLLVLEAGKVPGLMVLDSRVSIICLCLFIILFLAYKKIRTIRMQFVPFA